MIRRLLAASLLLALPGCIAPPSDSAEACRFDRVTSFAVQFRNALPQVKVLFEGKPAELVLDTGATGTAITQAAADRLALHQDRSFSFSTSGLAGQIVNYGVKSERVQVGDAVFRDLPVVVLAAGLTGFGTPAPDGLLGNDVLGQYDVDFDLPNNQVSLYRRRDCPSGLPPWTDKATRLLRPTAAPPRNRPHLAVALNGVAMVAFLDTGASASVVDTAAALRAGVTAGMLDRAPAAQLNGSTPGPVTSRLQRFTSLEIGEVNMTGPLLLVTDLRREADMILGVPFLRRHRVWMAYGNQRMFIGPETKPTPP